MNKMIVQEKEEEVEEEQSGGKGVVQRTIPAL
jgi:hypothetical protein